jgi:hypothetical protein
MPRRFINQIDDGFGVGASLSFFNVLVRQTIREKHGQRPVDLHALTHEFDAELRKRNGHDSSLNH